jgi:cell division protein FtsB
VLILVATLVGNLIKLGAEKKHNAALNAQLDAINAELAVVEGDIDYKSTDEWIERYAREHLGMLRPGEKPFAPKK